MPFLGVDSWRWQYFRHSESCPDNVIVPIDDATAWELHPSTAGSTTSCAICETQGLPSGPHGTSPPQFPVFSKPIYNMRGMGRQPRHRHRAGLRGIAAARPYVDAALRGAAYQHRYRHGQGRDRLVPAYHRRRRRSRHLRLLDRACEAEARARGLSWRVARPQPRRLHRHRQFRDDRRPHHRVPSAHVGAVARSQRSGMARRGRPALCRRRLALRRGAPARLQRRVLFGEHGIAWDIDRSAVRGLLRIPGISSIQITFDNSIPQASHAMPPGGFRLAIVNCWDLAAGEKVRGLLKDLFARSRKADPKRGARLG